MTVPSQHFSGGTQILETATAAAQKAGRLIVDMRTNAKVSAKASNNLVTEADLKAEALIVDTIHSRFPDHGIYAEETAERADPEGEHVWIIDPLDGTNNYAHGIPHYSVSIAYAERGEVLAGVVFDPLRDELFAASRGKGAALNGEPIQVSDVDRLTGAVIATGFFYDRGEIMRRTLSSLQTLFDRNIQGMRRSGSAALDLAYVACGRFEGFFEYQLSLWDYAAGWILVREAGGRCVDPRGADLTVHSGAVVGANAAIHDALVEAVSYG